MTMNELAALDAAERRRIHGKAIEAVTAEIEERRAVHGRTDALERQLASLKAKRP